MIPCHLREGHQGSHQFMWTDTDVAAMKAVFGG
jgi:hypothetical protein